MGKGEGEGEGRSVGEWEVELTDLYKKNGHIVCFT